MSCLHEAVNAAETESTSTMSRVKKHTSRENPFKECLENQGIVFPTTSQSKRFETPTSDVYRTAPLTKSEEEEQLKMVLSISSREPLKGDVANAEIPACKSGKSCCPSADTNEIEDLMGLGTRGSSHTVNVSCDKETDAAADTEVANLLLALRSK